MTEKIDLSNLSGYAAQDLFSAALEKTIDNINDPNTMPKTMRSITLTLKIKPSEDRATAETELSVSTKLAGIRPFQKSIWFGKDDDGTISAYADNPKQETLKFEVTKGA